MITYRVELTAFRPPTASISTSPSPPWMHQLLGGGIVIPARPARESRCRRKASRHLALACTASSAPRDPLAPPPPPSLPARPPPPPSARSALLSRFPHRHSPLLLLPRRRAPPFLPRRRRALRGHAAPLRPSAPIATPSRPPRPVLSLRRVLCRLRLRKPPPPQELTGASTPTATHRSVHSSSDPLE
ncbi:hypothetical protein PVAP13_3NG128601 [Panicum virgatum]|uniref:Uncharacterized protein n=1 Tax=Panicum virgatum TaxID=38727 RepID=A0A8T0UC74_PANVG|nr:hypothetical protein PVAP13_3NG128601 [Panicum virgatum]